ncbi:MAG TPA: hypothetical protein VEY30_13090, partial [Myxococcaceae bacterium]|nr:hypothetical protein [Myxococcaceae bacterium]
VHAPNTPASLEAVVLRALEKQPEDRFASALEMGEALERALGSQPLGRSAGVSDLMQRLFDGAERGAEELEDLPGVVSPTMLT